MAEIDTFTLGYTIAGILVFLLWYTLLSSRLFGFLVSLILRFVMGEKAVLDIKGIHIALLTGRIYFRRLMYVTPNAALCVLDGTVRIFWWRSLLLFAGIKEQKTACHISISLNGLEYTIANNSNRREQIEKILGMRLGRETQVAVQEPLVASVKPFLFDFSPRILVCVHRGVISIGNDVSLPETAIVVSFDSAKAIIHTSEPSFEEYVYSLVVSAQLFQVTVREQPPLHNASSTKPNKPRPDPPRRVTPSDVFSPSFKSTKRRESEHSAAEPTGRSGASFLDVDRVVSFGRNIKQLGSHAIGILEGAGAKLMKLDEHFLSLLSHNDRGLAKNRISVTGVVILKCSRLLVHYHQECDGVASSVYVPPPIWKIELDFFSSFLRYGPAEHAVRNAISRFFLPWTYETQIVKPVSSVFEKKERRGFDFLTIDVHFREVVDVLVPFDAQKSAFYPDLHVELPERFQRVKDDSQEDDYMGWLHIKCGDGVALADVELYHEVTSAEVARHDSVALVESDPLPGEIDAYMSRAYPERLVGQIAVVLPWACRGEQGTEMTVTGTLYDVVIRTSICNHPLVISEKLDLSVSMPYPLVWNSFRVWTIGLSFTNSHLQYLADHITLFSQLGAHWSRGDPIQRIDFVPYDMRINIQMIDCIDLRLIASPNNSFHVAGKTNALDPGTPLVLLRGSSLEASIRIPLSKFLRPSMDIHYDVLISAASLSLIPGAGSVLEATLANELHQFVSNASLGLKGVYAYFYEWTPDMRDVFSMDVKCDGASMILQPFYLSALNALSRNYFGADKRALAPKVLVQRGGVNQAELEVQQEMRRLKGECINQSDSYITVHLQNTELLLPHSLLSDKESASASIPSLVIEMHSSFSNSSFSDMNIDCSPLIITFNLAPIESAVVALNPQFSECGVGNLVLEGLHFKSSSLYGPKPEFSCYCTSKEITVSSLYGTLLPLQMLHLVNVCQNLLGDWSLGIDLSVNPTQHLIQKQLNSTFIHLKSVNLTVVLAPFSMMINSANVTYDSSNDFLDSCGPQGVWSAPETIIRAFLHSPKQDSAAPSSPSSKSQSPSNAGASKVSSPKNVVCDVSAHEMLYLSVPFTYSSTVVRSCIDVDAAAQREFWSQQDKESGRLQFNEEDASKGSPRSAASNSASNTASTAGGASSASGRIRRHSRASIPQTISSPRFDGISAAVSAAESCSVATSTALIARDLWYNITSDTPRGDAGDRQPGSTAEEDLFDVNDFGSAHSSVSTPNEDELHSARSLSSDSGGSRIVLNDVEMGSSFSTPRELRIDDVSNEKHASSLHVTATLGWRERLAISGRIGQSLHPVAFSGPILDLPTLNSTYFDTESDADKRSHPPDQGRDSAAGVGSTRRPIVDSDGTSSDCAVNDEDEEEKFWCVFEALTRAEIEFGHKRSCHFSKVLSFSKGIACRVNAIAPAALELIVDYLTPFKNEVSIVAELQLPIQKDDYRIRVGRTTPIRDSPISPESESSLRAVIALFEFAHQAVRNASFSSSDAMFLEHTLKSSFSVTVPFVAVDVYPPPPIIAYSSLLPANHQGHSAFSVIRIVAGGFKYQAASQTEVPKAAIMKKSGAVALQPLPSPSLVKTRITLRKWALIAGSDDAAQLPSSDCDTFSRLFPNCFICGPNAPQNVSFLISNACDSSKNDAVVFASSLSSPKVGVHPTQVSSLTFPRAVVICAGQGCFSGANTLVVAGMSVANAQSAYLSYLASRMHLVHQLNAQLAAIGPRKNARSRTSLPNNGSTYDHVAAAAAASAGHPFGMSTPLQFRNRSASISVMAPTPSSALPPDVVMSPSRELHFSPIVASPVRPFASQIPMKHGEVAQDIALTVLVPIKHGRELGEALLAALLLEHNCVRVAINDGHWTPRFIVPSASADNAGRSISVTHDADMASIMIVNGEQVSVVRGFDRVCVSDGLRWNHEPRQKHSAVKKKLFSDRLPVFFSVLHRKLLSEFFDACSKLRVLMCDPQCIETLKSTSIPSNPPPLVTALHSLQNLTSSFSFHFDDLTLGLFLRSSAHALRLSVNSVSGRSLSQDADSDISVIACSDVLVDAKDLCMDVFPDLISFAAFCKTDPARTLFAAIKMKSVGRKVTFASVPVRRSSLPSIRRVSVDDSAVLPNSSPSRTSSFHRSQGHVRSHSDPTASLVVSPVLHISKSKGRSLQVEIGRFSLKLRSPSIHSEVCMVLQSFLYISSKPTFNPSGASNVSASPSRHSIPAQSFVLAELPNDSFETSLIEFREVSVKYIVSTNIGVYDFPSQEIRLKRVLLQNRKNGVRGPSLSCCNIESISVDLKSYLFDGGRLVMYIKNWTPPSLHTQPVSDQSVKHEIFVNPNQLISCFDLMIDSVALLFRISPDVSSPVMPIEITSCIASFAENYGGERFMTMSLPRQRVGLSASSGANSDTASVAIASKPFSRGVSQRVMDPISSGNALDFDFASLDLHFAVSPVILDERTLRFLCCIGSTRNVINSDMFNHVLQLFRIMSNEMFSIVDTLSKQSHVRAVFKKYDKSDIGSVAEVALPEMLSELGYPVSPEAVLQFSDSSARVSFLEFLAITQVFASRGSVDPAISVRQKESRHSRGAPAQKQKDIFNRLNATIFIQPIHIAAVTNPDGGHGALAIFDSGRMFARITTAPGSSLCWCLRFTDLNVQFNRLVSWQVSTGQFSLRNVFFFNTKLELRNQVMPLAFKGNSSAAADFSHTKIFLQPGCQVCISDVISHFSAAFSAFSTNINRDSSANSQKLLTNMSAAAKAMMEYAKSSAAALEKSTSLAAGVIKFQDIEALASYDDGGGQVFGPFNFGCMENSRDLITSRSCLPDVALSVSISGITFIVLARGKSEDTHKAKDTMRQSLQFQGRVQSAYLHLFVNQDRAKLPSTHEADNFVGLKIHEWTLKLLWKFSDTHRPASLDAIFRLPGPALRLYPQTIFSLSAWAERWTAAPSQAGSDAKTSSTVNSKPDEVAGKKSSAPSAIHINVSVKIDSGQVTLIRNRKQDSETHDSAGGSLKHLLFMKGADSASIDEVCKLPLPGIAVKVAFVINSRPDAGVAVAPSKGHRRTLSRDLFLGDSVALDKGSLGPSRDLPAASAARSDDSSKHGLHRRKPSSASENSFPDIDHERTNIVNVTLSAGTIQLTPKILEFFSELRAVMPVKPAARQVQRKSSAESTRRSALTALASDGRVVAAKNAISDQWFVLHLALDESKLELRGDGKLSDQVVSFKVANSSILYNAGRNADVSSVHFISLSMEKVQLNYSGKSEVYGLGDTNNLISAEHLFLHNTTCLDELGDQSVGFCECQRLFITANLVNPDVFNKATRFMHQWTASHADQAAGSANSSPGLRKEPGLSRGNSVRSFSSSDDGTPTSQPANAPLNLKERCFFYHFVVGILDIECDLGREQNQYLVAQISPLGLSVSNPLSQSDDADTSDICYTLGWNSANSELSCKIKTSILTSWSYIHMKQPILSPLEGIEAGDSGRVSTSVALTGIVSSVFEMDARELEEIFFFDVGTLAVDILTLPEDQKVLVDIFYSDLLLCMSASSIVALRRSLDQLMLVFSQRMAWHGDDAAMAAGKRRGTFADDDKGVLPRRKGLAEPTALTDRFSRIQTDLKTPLPATASHVEIGYLCIAGENTRVHIFGSSIIDAGMGWHASFESEYLAVNLDSNLRSGAIEHEFKLELNNVCLSMNQGFGFDPDKREIKVKKPCPILRISDVTKLHVLGKPVLSKLSGSEVIMCELWSDFSKSLWVTPELYLFKNMKTLIRAYSSDGEVSGSRHATAAKAKGRAGSREYQVGKCFFEPKIDAVGEGSAYTVATLLKNFGLGTTDDIVPIIYAGLVDPLLAVRAKGVSVLKLASRLEQ